MGNNSSFEISDNARYAMRDYSRDAVINTVIGAYNSGESCVFVSTDSSREEEYCSILKDRLGPRMKSCYKNPCLRGSTDPRDDGIFVNFVD